MLSKLMHPPEYIDIKGPVIFLAGPIQGAPRWQDTAIIIIKKLAPNIHIASPRREYFEGEFVYDEQVDWETHYLRRAAENGVIMFWLANEFEHRCDRSYAQTTRFELGEWKSRHEENGAKIVVGIEEGFTNARYIRRRLSQDCPEVPLCKSLEETCRKAIELAGNSKAQ